MYIGIQSLVLAEIFVAHPAGMAGCTVLGHRGNAIEQVPIDEPTAEPLTSNPLFWIALIGWALALIQLIIIIALAT